MKINCEKKNRERRQPRKATCLCFSVCFTFASSYYFYFFFFFFFFVFVFVFFFFLLSSFFFFLLSSFFFFFAVLLLEIFFGFLVSMAAVPDIILGDLPVELETSKQYGTTGTTAWRLRKRSALNGKSLNNELAKLSTPNQWAQELSIACSFGLSCVLSDPTQATHFHCASHLLRKAQQEGEN